jgi:hypothetical protein
MEAVAGAPVHFASAGIGGQCDNAITGVPLGPMVNELIRNAAKYGTGLRNRRGLFCLLICAHFAQILAANIACSL